MDRPGQKKYTFRKEERLKGKKKIEGLFSKGSSFYLHPLLLKYQQTPEADTTQVLFTVSTKKVRSAVKRNLVKRRMREAYRLNNKELFAGAVSSYVIAFVYLDEIILPYQEIENKLTSLLRRLLKKNRSVPE